MFAVRAFHLSLLFSSAATPTAAEPLTLAAAIEIALTHANEMIQAREDVLLVDADYATAVSAVLPRIDVTSRGGAFYSGSRLIETRNTGRPAIQPNEPPAVEFGDFEDFPSNSFLSPEIAFGLAARQLVFDGGRWWTAIAQAEDNRVSREADLRAVTNLVRARVARTFFGLERARQAKYTLEAQVEVDRAQVERAQALLRAGRGAPADVAAAQRNLANDQILLLDADTAEGQARRAFNLQLGRPSKTPVVLVMPAEVASSSVAVERFVPSLERLQVLTKAHRPELASLRAGVDAARKAIALARADYWPTIEVSGNYNRNSRRPDRVFFEDPFQNFTATFEVSMQWNVFEGFATNAAVQRAQIDLRKQQANYEENERQLLAEVEDSLQRLQNQQLADTFARQQVAAAEETVRLARGLYEAGRGTFLELRDAELELTRARIASINARLDAAVAHADLVQAVGTDDWVTR